jgi:three-Cys-motif partner protein
VPKKEYGWTSIDDPPIIQPHSIAKHHVLEDYLKRYIRKLTANPAIRRLRLHIVDGFAGGCIYRRENNGNLHFGSPVIIHNTVRDEVRRINESRINPFELELRLYLVDTNPANLNVLKAVLNNHGIANSTDGSESTIIIHGEFEQYREQIIKSVSATGRKHRVLFLLDQYGYTDVPMPTLAKILHTLPDAEILLTFATDWIIDYMSTDKEMAARQEKTLRDLGINSDLYKIDVQSIKESPLWRHVAQNELANSIRINSGARYYTPFFIKTTESHRTYWLIHLSQHEIARDEMIKTHWGEQNYFTHPGGAGFDMLGYDPARDELITGQGSLDFCFEFDNHAKELSKEALRKQLPEYLYRAMPITLRDILRHKSNGTPADSNIIASVLAELIDYKQIEVRDHKTGAARTKASTIQIDDLIRYPVQRVLFT